MFWSFAVEHISEWHVFLYLEVSVESLCWRSPIIYFGDQQTNTSTSQRSSKYDRQVVRIKLFASEQEQVPERKATLRDTPNIKVEVKGTEIEQTSVLKLLGEHIGDKLNFGEHAKNTCIKMSRQVGVLLRLKTLFRRELNCNSTKQQSCPTSPTARRCGIL